MKIVATSKISNFLKNLYEQNLFKELFYLILSLFQINRIINKEVDLAMGEPLNFTEQKLMKKIIRELED